MRPPAYAIWSQFAPSRDRGLSIQEQLVHFFRREVATGALRPGIRVPASRALAQELKLARGTVSGAYERLAAEGFLVTRHGFGTLVAGTPAKPKRAKEKLSRSGESTGSRRARELMRARPRETHADWPLTPGVPALDAFPFALGRGSTRVSTVGKARPISPMANLSATAPCARRSRATSARPAASFLRRTMCSSPPAPNRRPLSRRS